jgi:predicted esterase
LTQNSIYMQTTHIFALFLFLTLLFSPSKACSQAYQSGPQVLTFFSDVDDSEQPYALYLPKKYNPKKKYPLVVMLHGAGSNHRLALRRVFGKSNEGDESDAEATRNFPKWDDVEYIVASTYARGTAGYQGFREKDVMDMLADVKKRFTIDEDRCYLTGLSMGGGGTVWLGLSYPDLWAAIAPVCPATYPESDALAPNAGNMAVHFFHGEKDPVVPVQTSRDWVKRLKDLGFSNIEYKEFPGVQHNSWINAYENGSIFTWFSKFKRNPHPNRVQHVSADCQHGKAYWVTFGAIEVGKNASIDAEKIGTNKFKVKTENLFQFALNPSFESNGSVRFIIDGQEISVDNGKGLYAFFSFSKMDGKWVHTDPKSIVPPLLTKKQNSEGPIKAAFATSHLYIYGTADNPNPQELQARIDTATKAANWSEDRGWFMGRVKFYPVVMSDKELRQSDYEKSNLILFGTKETNAVIAKFADKLPLHLKASETKNYGLFYVFPMNGRYIAVNSGIPWWTGKGLSSWYLPQPQMSIYDYKDFSLYQGSAGNVVSEGFFDNNWKLTEEKKKELGASSVLGF